MSWLFFRPWAALLYQDAIFWLMTGRSDMRSLGDAAL
jgi:hypothetical protein